jgi:DNA-binding NarL/FixJ family response regulator
MCDLEMPEALPLVNELSAGVGIDNAREAVRSVGHRLACYSRFGALDLAEADRVSPLLPAVDDALVESGFLSIYASHLALAARYEDARSAAARLLTTAQRYRLDFAVPYALGPAGIAEAGLRSWEKAECTLRDGIDEARKGSNRHGELNCLAALLRTLAQRGRCETALELLEEYAMWRAAPVTLSMRMEFVATQAFVLAASDRIDEAQRAIDSIRGLSAATESIVLTAAVYAIISAKRHCVDAIDRVNDLAETALASGGADLLVTAYRAAPELMPILVRSPASQRVSELIRRVGDDDLASAVGHRIPRGSDRAASLTPRQREVYELLCQGLTNREIAHVLVIAEKTAKLHVQHVFDKVGVRSRKAIAMRAALERPAQATSAIAETGVGADS